MKPRNRSRTLVIWLAAGASLIATLLGSAGGAAASVASSKPGAQISLPVTLGSITVTAVTASPGFVVDRAPNQDLDISLGAVAQDSAGGSLWVDIRSTSTPRTARIGSGGPCIETACSALSDGQLHLARFAPPGAYGVDIVVTGDQYDELVVPVIVLVTDPTSTKTGLVSAQIKLGQQITVAGSSLYRFGTEWVAWPSSPVLVQFRSIGTSIWITRARTTTSSSGRFLWRTTGELTGQWRAVTPAAPDFATSVSLTPTVNVSGKFTVRRLTSCTSLRKLFAGGVAKPGVHNQGKSLAFAPNVSRPWWRANHALDTDADGLACER
jgi:hypothetical protein